MSRAIRGHFLVETALSEAPVDATESHFSAACQSTSDSTVLSAFIEADLPLTQMRSSAALPLMFI